MINQLDDLCPDLEQTGAVLRDSNFQTEFQQFIQEKDSLTIKKIIKYGEKYGLVTQMDIKCYKLYLLQIWQQKKTEEYSEFIFWKQKLMHISFLDLIFKFQNKSDDEFQDYIAKIQQFEKGMFDKFMIHYTQYDLKKKIKKKIESLNNISPTNLRMISEAEFTVLERGSMYDKNKQQKQLQLDQKEDQFLSELMINDENNESDHRNPININNYDFKLKVVPSKNSKEIEQQQQYQKQLIIIQQQEQQQQQQQQQIPLKQQLNSYSSKDSKISTDFECSEPSDSEESPIKLPQNFQYKINTLPSQYNKHY